MYETIPKSATIAKFLLHLSDEKMITDVSCKTN